jgi:uncharacterized protein (TIGR02996 family)
MKRKSLREALESALIENPDDLASHAAYADLLQEQGDPRGEFIQVQLALENESLPRTERLRLESRERELLLEHRRAWLGELADLFDDEDERHSWRFARGWLDTIRIEWMEEWLAELLADAPQLALLRQLLIDDSDSEGAVMRRLSRSQWLGNLRVLRVGEEIDPDFDERITYPLAYAEDVERLVARLPRLEELYLLAHWPRPAELFAVPMSNLRVLQLYHADDYPLDVLADNPALGNLTTLLFHPRSHGGFARGIDASQLQALCQSENLPRLSHLRLRLTELGDEGVSVLVESGMIERLRVLDLRLGCVTDEGAGLLADCAELAELELLNLSRNALTATGVAMLEATGVNLIADGQHDEDDDEWTYVGYVE